MKLWDKGYTIDDRIERFTTGRDRELDIDLAPYDVQGSMAHANMLAHIGLLTIEENTCLLYTSPSPRDRQKSRMPSSA